MNFSKVGMILAAGYGKRMLPLTQSVPKPLLNINGITLLENSINFLIALMQRYHSKYKSINPGIGLLRYY